MAAALVVVVVGGVDGLLIAVTAKAFLYFRYPSVFE